MLFHMQVTILVLGAKEHRKQLRVVGFWGVVVLFLTTATDIFAEGNVTVSGLCETESFVEFCCLLMGCLKKKTHNVLCMCCFYLYMESGGGNENLEEENHQFLIRLLRLDEQENRVRISKPVGEMRNEKASDFAVCFQLL